MEADLPLASAVTSSWDASFLMPRPEQQPSKPCIATAKLDLGIHLLDHLGLDPSFNQAVAVEHLVGFIMAATYD